MLFSFALSLPVTAGWKLSWYKAQCRGDLNCCAVDICRPNMMYKDPLPCITRAESTCHFPASSWGQTFIDEKISGVPSDGCTGKGLGEAIVALPDDMFDRRFQWARGNLTIGPLDPYSMNSCFGTSWYMQFVNWPSMACDQQNQEKDEMYRVDDFVRVNSEYQFDAPTLANASNRYGAYITIDLSVAMGHRMTNALRLLAGNQDCLFEPITLEHAASELGVVNSYQLPGKSYQRRAITVALAGIMLGQKSAPALFTAPADLVAQTSD